MNARNALDLDDDGEDKLDFETAVTAVIRGLKPGELIAYGEVAAEAGFPGAARAVGRVLATSEDLPWWRVVTSNGRLVPGHEQEHTRRLEAENVIVRNGRVAR
jgi:methylated-DNA-protein-cysteine methyltransferase-like protein